MLWNSKHFFNLSSRLGIRYTLNYLITFLVVPLNCKVNFVVRNFFSRQIHNNISSWLWKQESLNEWTNWHWHCRTIIERCQFKKKIKSFQSTFKKAKFVKVGVLIWVRIFLESLKKERSSFFWPSLQREFYLQ